jgi:hypothetical protein
MEIIEAIADHLKSVGIEVETGPEAGSAPAIRKSQRYDPYITLTDLQATIRLVGDKLCFNMNVIYETLWLPSEVTIDLNHPDSIDQLVNLIKARYDAI